MPTRIATLTSTRQLIKKHGLHVKKGLGQHFVIDNRILELMVESARVTEVDIVVEIGPGVGCLTQHLAEKAGWVIAVEVDRSLEPVLNEALGGYKNIGFVWGDILRTDLDAVVAEYRGTSVEQILPYKVVANLPYYITTPIIMTILEKHVRAQLLVVMIQKEVAERITARPGSKDYGVLSIAAQYYAETTLVSLVPPTAFFPLPEVESAIIKLERRSVPPVKVIDENLFFQIVRRSFGQRRKTLLNSLGGLGMGISKEMLREVLEQVGIDSQRRAETLDLEEFAVLTNTLAPLVIK
ncbi:MAG: 16S rRNA (adenine(1518)-N(6)/adenine(1519)-N(6))-dimethyltransferase RsmA [Firmicutes bacterium]|nr:16S rRNA (adenine(1518)-N(6)/adenine(1519)-N(6))-dimethyltransferase RsmA [Bacillota bacterium]